MDRIVCTAIIELGGMDVGRTAWILYPTYFGVAHAGRKSIPLVEYIDVTWTSYDLDLFYKIFLIYLRYGRVFWLYFHQTLSVHSHQSLL